MAFVDSILAGWYAVIAANVWFNFIPQWNSKFIFFAVPWFQQLVFWILL